MHSSAMLGGVIYVFFGYHYDSHVETIERLNVAANETNWIYLSIPGLSTRWLPLVAPLNDSELLVAGGYSK